VLQPLQQARRPYDSVRDLELISLALVVPQVVVAFKSLLVRDLRELIVYAQSRPGQLSYGSASTGGSTHLAGELLSRATGAELVHVPYRGIAPALVDLIGGQVELAFADLQPVVAGHKNGEYRVLGVMGEERSPQLPDVPTFKEHGHPEVVSINWYALFALSGTPADRVTILRDALLQALSDAEVVRALTDAGAMIRTSTPEDLRAFVVAEQAKWGNLIQTLADRPAQR